MENFKIKLRDWNSIKISYKKNQQTNKQTLGQDIKLSFIGKTTYSLY